MNRLTPALAFAFALALGTGPAECLAQTPTRVMVRVVARDAKIIGSGVGGAKVTVVNAETGAILAEGLHGGGTGNTQLIMNTAHARGMTVYDTEGTAGFLAELDISEPTIVNISAAGPLGYPQAVQTATKQMLVVPGRHVEGDGVVLELHGFIVEIQEPEPLTPVEDVIDVRVRVRMMCGCPIEPGGLWDAADKEFAARLKADGAVVASVNLQFAGRTSMFRGRVPVPESARGKDLTLEVLVSEPGSQNFGRHEIPLGP
ncbi:MAG: hypothetical protein JSV86_19280 [Gemmatimonadota bacterium]|nr:MAG: hypothetical protein JSV86_19280 [Gemmatimonadota bacterium]